MTAARVDAPDSAVNIALKADSDEPNAAQSPLNERRFNSGLLISTLLCQVSAKPTAPRRVSSAR